ncbi:MAG: protein phosphatase 2C domain-containing protein [Gemmatimonadota bacterium]
MVPIRTPVETQDERPRADQIDVFGLTHPGKVRTENQDQFLIASLHKTMMVHYSSMPPDLLGRLTSDSRGFVFLVADGVGGGPSGKLASGTALQAIVDYVIHTMDLYIQLDEKSEAAFLDQLRRSVERSHEKIQTEGGLTDSKGMATTLTMVVVRWPKAYLLHVGDSRCYRLRNRHLDVMTKDQTMAQVLLDAGALTEDTAEQSGLKHVLWSALGGREASPDVLTEDIEWDDVMLLCSDGLTKHVSNEEIAEHLGTKSSSEEIARSLVELTLQRGASDNVTVVVSRLRTQG